MTVTAWLIFIAIIQVIHFAGTWKLYQKAGRQAWEAAVPIYNAVVLTKIIKRPWWWVILLFIPIVNQIMFPVFWVETIRSFGKNSLKDTILVIVTLGLYIYYLNYVADVTYQPDRSLRPKSNAGEWVSSILFAVVAATIVHTYVMQPFTIPTSSLEKTLLVGDFLFVSKFHYGARVPMTPISFPMVHDTIPLLKKRSYVKGGEYPYMRIPGFQKIKRNDIVVFSWPVDTLVNILNPYGGTFIKPMDKKSNYVKRAVGIPGDSLEVRDGYVYINGEKNQLPDRAKLQFSYGFKTTGNLSPRAFKRYDITDGLRGVDQDMNAYVLAAATEEAAAQLQSDPNVSEVFRYNTAEKGQWDPGTFPRDDRYPWNTRFFGPIFVPEKGATVAITPDNLPLYRRIIEVYEGSELGLDHTISLSGTQVLLNGEPLTEYTFKQDYYWMMGDNRDNSQDARMWGFTPFNHVVGKPVFVWMSIDGINNGIKNWKFKWDRFFTTVGGNGEPVSYFKYFLILLAGWFIFDFVRKRRKKKA